MTRSDIQNFVYAQETQTAIRETLAEIIAIPSVSVDGTAPHVFGDATAAALDKILEIGKQYGFACENHDYYCGSILMPGENPADEIGIIAHIDVVPAVEGWEYPRFELTIDEEKGIFVGRGVRDDKGPAIMALTAMRFFPKRVSPVWRSSAGSSAVWVRSRSVRSVQCGPNWGKICVLTKVRSLTCWR